jgi:hypothetical protein
LQQKLKVVVKEPRILEYFHAHAKNCKKDLKVKDKAPMIKFLQTIKVAAAELKDKDDEDNLLHHLVHMIDVLERWKIAGLNRKLQIKPKQFEEYTDADGNVKERCTSVQLILKWVRQGVLPNWKEECSLLISLLLTLHTCCIGRKFNKSWGEAVDQFGSALPTRNVPRCSGRRHSSVAFNIST